MGDTRTCVHRQGSAENPNVSWHSAGRHEIGPLVRGLQKWRRLLQCRHHPLTFRRSAPRPLRLATATAWAVVLWHSTVKTGPCWSGWSCARSCPRSSARCVNASNASPRWTTNGWPSHVRSNAPTTAPWSYSPSSFPAAAFQISSTPPPSMEAFRAWTSPSGSCSTSFRRSAACTPAPALRTARSTPAALCSHPQDRSSCSTASSATRCRGSSTADDGSGKSSASRCRLRPAGRVSMRRATSPR